MIAGNHKLIVTKLEIGDSHRILYEAKVNPLYQEVIRWARGEQQVFVLDAIGSADLRRERLRDTRRSADGWGWTAARLGGFGVG